MRKLQRVLTVNKSSSQVRLGFSCTKSFLAVGFALFVCNLINSLTYCYTKPKDITYFASTSSVSFSFCSISSIFCIKSPRSISRGFHKSTVKIEPQSRYRQVFSSGCTLELWPSPSNFLCSYVTCVCRSEKKPRVHENIFIPNDIIKQFPKKFFFGHEIYRIILCFLSYIGHPPIRNQHGHPLKVNFCHLRLRFVVRLLPVIN